MTNTHVRRVQFASFYVAAITIGVMLFAGLAAAAPPVKRTVWMHAAAAWTTQARAHGAAATCTPWSKSGLLVMGCDFGARGRVSVSWTSEPCVYSLLVQIPRGGGLPSSFMRSSHAELNYCKPRWWTKPLPAPWSI